MIRILIICGKTASGKNAVVNELVKKHGYHQVVTYATRPMRKGEKQDITYHFISDKEFKQKIEEGFFAEYKSYNTEFGVWYYGTALEDLKNADDKSVIVLTPAGYRDVRSELHNENITCIYLYANNATLKKRLVKRGDDPKEADRRLAHDAKDFKNFEYEADRVVYNNYDEKLDDVLDKILNVVKRKKEK